MLIFTSHFFGFHFGMQVKTLRPFPDPSTTPQTLMPPTSALPHQNFIAEEPYECHRRGQHISWEGSISWPFSLFQPPTTYYILTRSSGHES